MNLVAERYPASKMQSLVGEAPHYDLAESVGPDLRLADVLKQADVEKLLAQPLGYGTPAGDADLRQAIAGPLGVSPDTIVITSGGMQALHLIAEIAGAEGGRILATEPLFPMARDAMDLGHGTVESISLRFDQGYQLDIDNIDSQLDGDVCLIALASPQNPSGVAIRPDDLQKLYKLMVARCPAAFLLVDETYREATYGDAPMANSALDLGDRVITVTSLSKCHGAPGLRIGWVVCRHHEFREQLVRGKFSISIACSSVDETLALALLDNVSLIQIPRRKLLLDAVSIVGQWVEENRSLFEWIRPDAGALCCMKLCEQTVADHEIPGFYSALAARGARVAPGSWFGETDRVFRVGFAGLPQELLLPALNCLAEAARAAAYKVA